MLRSMVMGNDAIMPLLIMLRLGLGYVAGPIAAKGAKWGARTPTI